MTDRYPVLRKSCAVLRDRAGPAQFPVAIAWGKHLFPFRTEQLSPTAPMVLGSQGPGRVGRRRFLHRTSRPWAARSRCDGPRAGGRASRPQPCTSRRSSPPAEHGSRSEGIARRFAGSQEVNRDGAGASTERSRSVVPRRGIRSRSDRSSRAAHLGRPESGEVRRPGEGARPSGAPVLPDRAPSGGRCRVNAGGAPACGRPARAAARFRGGACAADG